MNFLGFMNVGGPELILLLIIILVLFGAKKLPDLAKGMGQAIREFQKAKDEPPPSSKAEVAANPVTTPVVVAAQLEQGRGAEVIRPAVVIEPRDSI